MLTLIFFLPRARLRPPRHGRTSAPCVATIGQGASCGRPSEEVDFFSVAQSGDLTSLATPSSHTPQGRGWGVRIRLTDGDVAVLVGEEDFGASEKVVGARDERVGAKRLSRRRPDPLLHLRPHDDGRILEVRRGGVDDRRVWVGERIHGAR
uniref:Uncharacterized protein n=1 Tax=Oryza brachyantha TaxID=4533 RepID=J3NCS8_ORYBR